MIYKTIVIYIIRIKILYSVFCSLPLQNEASPISRNTETIMISDSLLKEVFQGLSLLTNHLTFCMKMLTTKNSPFIFRCVGSIQKGKFPTMGKWGYKMEKNEMLRHKMINLSSGYVSLSEHNVEGQEFLISISRGQISISYHLSNKDFETLVTGINNF